MRRYSTLVAAGGLLALAGNVMAAPPNNGYIGVYGDAAGTICCVTTDPSGNGRMYVFAVTGGSTAAGFTSAEFRIALEPATPGATFTWNVAAGATSVGDPMDNGAGGGASVTFPSCQTVTGTAGDKIELGSVMIRGVNGLHQLVVRQHTTSSPSFACPSMVLCDAPTSTRVCLTLQDGDPALNGEDPVSFRTAMNDPACSGASCGFVAVESA